MKLTSKRALPVWVAAVLLAGSSHVFAHGNVTPQAVDVTGLEALGEGWREENPYVGNEAAIKIGAAAYNSNCARCHGLEAVSGGIAPDLRNLPNGKEGDEFFLMRIRNGSVRNGVTYMPKFEGIIQQEGMWAIRAWLQSISVETVEAAAKAAPAAAPAATTTEPAKTETAPAAAPAATEPAKTEAAPAAAPAATEPAKTEAAPAAAPAATEPAKTETPPEKKTELKTEPTSGAPAESQLAKVTEKGVLEVAVYKDFPPYSWMDKNEPKGIDVEIGKAIAKRLAVSASIRMMTPGENVEDDLRNNVWKGHYLGGGTADVMLHAPIDRDFSAKVDQVSFIAPYQLEKLAFALDTSKLGKDVTIEKFTSEPIGVELDTLSDFYLLRTLDGKVSANIRHYKNIPEAIAALKKGEVPAVMGPRGEIEGNLMDKPANIVVQHLDTPGLSRGSSWAMGVAVRAKYKDLTEAVGKAMADMVKDGTVSKIFAAHGVAYEAPAEAPTATN